MMMSLVTLLLASAAISATTGRMIQLNNNDKNSFVNEHNSLRGKVSPAAVNMEQLAWNNALAKEAARHISQCIFAHSTNRKNGENIYVTTGSLSYEAVVRSWYDEVKDYNYYCNSCKPGKVCGHYTQVVWDKTTKVGCAVELCPTIHNLGWRNAYLVMCTYNPAGNIRGQRPYDINNGCKNICKKCPNVTDSDCYCVGTKEKKLGVITKAEKSNILKSHRKLRKSVTPRASDMALIKWNKNLAKKAQSHAEDCKFATNSLGYGENIHFSYGITPDFNAVITRWYNQGKDYNYYCNQCKQGKTCIRYQQLVQSKARKLGCGSYICPTVQGLQGWTDVWIFVCFYNRKVDRGVTPYKTKETCTGSQCVC